ncbi:hypothetical protein QSE00_19315 [Arenibacter sp. M-2]|uniref:hypothetical protein n=1 Tax=Arenibacter sp. M-2 TaxID=3053612 RepID=UPI00257052D2|nr:hypothetical protein [Arenibacter sp. M-2]MDL5513975.1 hypothetical protein [Arenibacter sp. M-2]
MKDYIVLTPQELDIDKILSDNSTSLDNEYTLDNEYLKYLISYILSKLAFYIENFERNKGDKYVPLAQHHIPIHSKKDVLVRPDKHKKHVEFLTSDFEEITYRLSRTKTKQKLISMLYRKDYEVGKVAYSYRINPRYKGQKLSLNYIHNHKLIQKIREHNSVIPSIITSGKYRFLGKYFDSSSLKINVDEAVLLSNARFSSHKDYGKYLNEMFQIIDLSNGVYRFYNKDETDARLHTNISRLPKVYRQYLTYNNNHLVEVDLSNSIIYFLSMLTSNRVNNSVLNKFPFLLMFYKTLETLDTRETDLLKELSTNGKFYDYFIPSFEDRYTSDDLTTMFEQENDGDYNGHFDQKRKVAKRQILAMIFAASDAYKVEQDIFFFVFPDLLNTINAFKDKHDYEKLSHTLLQLESHYMLDVVAREFNRVNAKKAPIFTLHDCLITTQDYSTELTNTMRRVFEQEFLIAPKMESKNWK